ncbi:MAG: isoprenylcysteine carboxylmethyltransferase family protein [Chloroflexi bacterium]|nr:isoprenylcysteine carboxylmethyltransferase family protein [Chloroflexota bacterium]
MEIDNTSPILFLVSMASEILTTLAVVVSIALPRHRIWPPRQRHDWGQYAMLILFNTSAVGVFLLGILDWGNFSIPAWARLLAGVPLWLAGNALALRAIAALGLASTAGGGTALLRQGPYCRSRNPQYLGFILALTGWTLMTDSALVLIAASAGFLPLLLVPFAEEPWLLEKHGAAYSAYMKAVPRFFSFKK